MSDDIEAIMSMTPKQRDAANKKINSRMLPPPKKPASKWGRQFAIAPRSSSSDMDAVEFDRTTEIRKRMTWK